ncbi:hypothetical protein POSPLADRAFT_1053035 [Postia placenta MAD-698-R-SB12]|uniref:Uncharacterized protein n=1 Tax=Postia placenta MAD-698-R-SB12 TaxID=670580 RepID=A0A1X6NCT8_9APHY|nr:hypothetical protein POSPLADRAFT_1053035 [Postia placenta MAD-698-R-SB12]OSX66384.1 hypothetical protein POSPLADRAFT_1053035 [Postia placenta MAD-698-R-SB12]
MDLKTWGDGRFMKRRKTDGLNSRFDRMIETVSVLHSSPSTSSSSRTRRRHAASSSSLSATSYDAPKTPVDAYSGFDEGRLGEGFSVIKMRRAHAKDNLLDHSNEGRANYMRSKKRALPAPVPNWLCNTLSDLETHHPLRGLVSETSANVGGNNRGRNSHGVSPDVAAEVARSPVYNRADLEDPVFAFAPPTDLPALSCPVSSTARQEAQRSPPPHCPTLPVPSHELHNGRAEDTNVLSAISPTLDELSVGTDLTTPIDDTYGPAPFSKPGPASLISAVEPLRAVSIPFDDYDFAPYNDEKLDTGCPAQPGGAYPIVFSQADPSRWTTSSGGSSKTLPEDPFLVQTALLKHRRISRSATPARPQGAREDISATTNGEPFQPESCRRTYARQTSPERSLVDYLLLSPGTPEISRFRLEPHSTHISPQATAMTEDLVALSSPIAPMPFSTPGPAHPRPPRPRDIRVYFDAPAEDPCTSDPIEESDYALALDYDAGENTYDLDSLCFKWEKFDRSGPRDNDTVNDKEVSTDIRKAEQGTNGAVRREFGPVYEADLPQTPVLEAENGRSSSTLGFSPTDGNDEPIRKNATWILPPRSQVRTGTPVHNTLQETSDQSSIDRVISSPAGQVFAPAPGIFLSPLRGQDGQSEDTLDGNRTEAGADAHKTSEAAESGSHTSVNEAQRGKQRYSDAGQASTLRDFLKAGRPEQIHTIEKKEDQDLRSGSLEEPDDVQEDSASSKTSASQESRDTIESWTE